MLGLAVPAPEKDGVPQPFCISGEGIYREPLARLAETIEPKFYAFASALRGTGAQYGFRLDSEGLSVSASLVNAEGTELGSDAVVRVWRSTERAILEGTDIGVVLLPM